MKFKSVVIVYPQPIGITYGGHLTRREYHFFDNLETAYVYAQEREAKGYKILIESEGYGQIIQEHS